jgi:hypothetical protein
MRKAIFICACFLAYFSSGCVAGVVTEVRYRPIAAAPPPPRAAVSLEVVDSREAKLGGREKNLVGQVRGTYGNPFALRETAPVAQIVAAATSDALLHAGVRAQSDASRTVIVTIKKYWVDGYMAVTANIEVEVALRDSEERILFSQSIRGDATGSLVIAPQAELEGVFQNALAQYTRAAVASFQSPAFQNALVSPKLSQEASVQRLASSAPPDR